MIPANAGRLTEVLTPTLPSPWQLVGTAIVATLLIWGTFRIRAWFRDDDAGTGRNNDLLTDLRELQREGGLSEEEFRLIKTRLIHGSQGATKAPASTAEVVSKSPVSTSALKPDASPDPDQNQPEPPSD